MTSRSRRDVLRASHGAGSLTCRGVRVPTAWQERPSVQGRQKGSGPRQDAPCRPERQQPPTSQDEPRACARDAELPTDVQLPTRGSRSPTTTCSRNGPRTGRGRVRQQKQTQQRGGRSDQWARAGAPVSWLYFGRFEKAEGGPHPLRLRNRGTSPIQPPQVGVTVSGVEVTPRGVTAN